jgi:hypothetical protein
VGGFLTLVVKGDVDSHIQVLADASAAATGRLGCPHLLGQVITYNREKI